MLAEHKSTAAADAPDTVARAPRGARRLRTAGIVLMLMAVLEVIGAVWLCSWMLDRQEKRQARVALEQEMGHSKVVLHGPVWPRDAMGPQYFESVVELDLRGRHFTSKSLELVAELDELTKLVLWDIKLSDEDLKALRGLKELRSLSLLYCDVEGPGLRHLGGLEHLEELRIGPHIDDRAIRYLCGLPSLKRLTIYESADVTAEGLSGLKQAPRLEKLWLLNLRGITSDEARSLDEELKGVGVVDVRS